MPASCDAWRICLRTILAHKEGDIPVLVFPILVLFSPVSTNHCSDADDEEEESIYYNLCNSPRITEDVRSERSKEEQNQYSPAKAREYISSEISSC